MSDPAASVPSMADRLASVAGRFGTVSIGIDPHPYLLADWGLDDSADGVREFGLRVVEAATDEVGVLKPQVSFYERFGSAGFASLERVLAEARGRGLFVIGDAKRGDIGSTVAGYADAWLTPGSPLEVDALTMHPYGGFGSLAPALGRADATGKGLFVLAAMSNPEAVALQTAVDGAGTSVAAGIVSEVVSRNATGPSSAGLVLGATVDFARYGIDIARLDGSWVLAPGFGEQGARVSDLRGIFGAAADRVLVSTSRAVLSAGPAGLRDAIRRVTGEVRECLA
ncbi:orotidine-5'-phosphate decarboxylase [Desertivibrio insolitus]|uniref:orotidine-5'-phosphate decarboxylase n=1 Tax=Herbiconiux sp. SYSU D00978 TaxID=2812562 RepID=UPI001A973AB5|nr:orotidine-5'-phosphate decarboxylase [Herbiconiux sp. SYSU D00978]